jgi:hypothetical protein
VIRPVLDRVDGTVVLAGLALGSVAAARTADSRFDRVVASHVEELHTAAAFSDEARPRRATLTEADRRSLPPPVRRYLGRVLADDQPAVRTARLSQRGEFRLGGESGSWKPLRAIQRFAVRPPGFVWDATIDLLPLVPVRVLDAYVGGRGLLQARLFSALPVADAEPGPALDAGELVRYLAESVWFPTALFAEEVEWEGIDDRRARARIEDRGTAASLVFRFDDDDLVESVHTAKRYRQETGQFAPWTGYFEEYRERNGMLIPTVARVEWTLPDRDLPYWRARIEDVDHTFAE